MRHRESNPDPVDDIRQDNAHRAGAPNHLQGSGGNPMVGTVSAVHPGDVAAIRARLTVQSSRFPTLCPQIGEVNLDDLATLAAEIVGEIVAERTADLQRLLRRAEEFIAGDERALDLADVEIRRAVKRLVAVRAENEQLRGELAAAEDAVLDLLHDLDQEREQRAGLAGDRS